MIGGSVRPQGLVAASTSVIVDLSVDSLAIGELVQAVMAVEEVDQVANIDFRKIFAKMHASALLDESNLSAYTLDAMSTGVGEQRSSDIVREGAHATQTEHSAPFSSKLQQVAAEMHGGPIGVDEESSLPIGQTVLPTTAYISLLTTNDFEWLA